MNPIAIAFVASSLALVAVGQERDANLDALYADITAQENIKTKLAASLPMAWTIQWVNLGSKSTAASVILKDKTDRYTWVMAFSKEDKRLVVAAVQKAPDELVLYGPFSADGVLKVIHGPADKGREPYFVEKAKELRSHFLEALK